MKVLILGASGATGKLVAAQLLKRKVSLRLVVRPTSQVPEEILKNKLVECVRGNFSEFDKAANRKLIQGCDTVVSCLGHNLTLKGVFGQPRRLVSGVLANICDAINEEGNHKYKVVLMNTVGNVRKGEAAILSPGEKIIFALLKILLPPHIDNLTAAAYLSETIGKNNPNISWVAVRPDTLIDQETVTPYEIFESPTRGPLFDTGKTSRINVGHFITELLTDNELWNKWKYKMPVLYNKES